MKRGASIHCSREPNIALADVVGSKGDYRAVIQDLDAYLKLQPNGPMNEQARRVRAATMKMLAHSHPQD